MHPILFQFPGFILYTQTLFFVLAFLVAVLKKLCQYGKIYAAIKPSSIIREWSKAADKCWNEI